jgi:anti-sigma regulatory factor (Ser/Thr protein kinase)
VVEVVLTNQPEERQRLAALLETFAREHHLPRPVLQAADLALEEHLTNVMSYGYTGAGRREILVRLEVKDGWLLVEVSDDGKEFNPLEQPPVDLSLPLEQRPIGGLGVHLMRQCMDDLAYERVAGRNVLRMKKRVGPPPP